MEKLLEVINNRLDYIALKLKTNEFSGKDINSIKSIMLQVSQMDLLTILDRKIICIDILIKIEEGIQ